MARARRWPSSMLTRSTEHRQRFGRLRSAVRNRYFWRAKTLYAQYGAASSFLTVLNEGGKTSPLPANDPGGPSSSSWELEESLDVKWVHAIAPVRKDRARRIQLDG